MAKKSRQGDRERQSAAVPHVQVRPADEGGPNRKFRKEEARAERERLQRKIRRRRRMRWSGIALGALIVLGGATVLIVATQGSGTQELPGMLTTSAPWPANTADLLDRLKAIGLPALGQSMSIKQHIHAHLDIYVDGNKVQVPPDIGIASTYSSPIHTHDPTVTTTSDAATIHVEAPTNEAYTLGQFFDVWGVRLTASCLGGYCTSGGKTLQAFVDGKVVPDPRTIPLKEHEEIVLAYGAPSDVPSPVPSSFHFIKGE
ncbi:MAG: hypothetical protein ACJ758_09625 [Actinomycetota bacterium]